MANVETIDLEGSALPAPEREADDSEAEENDTPDEGSEAVEPPSPADEEARRVLLRRIQRYAAVFPEEIAGYDLTGISTMTGAELERALEDVVFLVESRRTTAQARSLFIAGLSLGEAGGPYLGLQLSSPHSLTATAAASNDLLRTIDEIALRYEAIARLDPVHRLGLSLAQLVLAVDRANRAAAVATGAASPASPPKSIPASAPAAPASQSQRADNVAREGFSDL